jgi:hypothetical protein
MAGMGATNLEEEHHSRQRGKAYMYFIPMFILFLEGVLSHSPEPRIAHRSRSITKRGNKTAITSEKPYDMTRPSPSQSCFSRDNAYQKPQNQHLLSSKWNTTKPPPQPQQHQKPKTTHTQANQATMAASESQDPKSTPHLSPNQSHSHSPAAQPKTASSKHP